MLLISNRNRDLLVIPGADPALIIAVLLSAHVWKPLSHAHSQIGTRFSHHWPKTHVLWERGSLFIGPVLTSPYRLSDIQSFKSYFWKSVDTSRHVCLVLTLPIVKRNYIVTFYRTFFHSWEVNVRYKYFITSALEGQRWRLTRVYCSKRLKLISVHIRPYWITVIYSHLASGFLYLYHAIENTANQYTGKPLYLRRYCTQPSHRAPRVCRIDCVGHCIFYGMV